MTPGAGEPFRLLRLTPLPAEDKPAGLAGPAARGLQAEVEIPAGSPLFDGHFPGHPILPGIAHLAQVREALRSQRDAEILAIRNLRLRQPVRPGDRLMLRLAATGADGYLRFDLRRGAELVSQGEVAIGSAGADSSAAAGPLPAPPPLGAGDMQPHPATLLPHTPPARLIQTILAVGDIDIVSTAVIPADHPLASHGKAPGFLGLEAAAQAAACLQALARQGDGEPPLGYLVGVRQADLASSLPCGAPLEVGARLAGSAAALAIYDFALRMDGALLSAGTLSTFLAG